MINCNVIISFVMLSLFFLGQRHCRPLVIVCCCVLRLHVNSCFIHLSNVDDATGAAVILLLLMLLLSYRSHSDIFPHVVVARLSSIPVIFLLFT